MGPLFDRRDTDYCQHFCRRQLRLGQSIFGPVGHSGGLLEFRVGSWRCTPYLVALLTRRFIVPYVGRIVRYTSAKPDNIAARQNIRHRGLVLLENLHSSSEYERIIVVGHSLGSILAYDLISYFWAARLDSRTVVEGSAEFQALQDLEKTVAELEKAPVGSERSAAIASYLTAQRVFGEALRARPKPKEDEPDRRWLITDLNHVGFSAQLREFSYCKK